MHPLCMYPHRSSWVTGSMARPGWVQWEPVGNCWSLWCPKTGRRASRPRWPMPEKTGRAWWITCRWGRMHSRLAHTVAFLRTECWYTYCFRIMTCVCVEEVGYDWQINYFIFFFFYRTCSPRWQSLRPVPSLCRTGWTVQRSEFRRAVCDCMTF